MHAHGMVVPCQEGPVPRRELHSKGVARGGGVMVSSANARRQRQCSSSTTGSRRRRLHKRRSMHTWVALSTTTSTAT